MSWQILGCLLLLYLRSSAANTELEQCDGDALTVDCRPRHEMHHIIKALKQELAETKQSIDKNCTICWSAPCLNDGECVALNITAFRCDCPQDYTGHICQTHIECKPDSCGEHASCFVKNHQINCVCDPGFSGDPRKGCSMSTVQACMSGDPHYTTFDRQLYEYMGTCPYTFVKPCNNTALGRFQYFEVKAKNELSAPKAKVSYVTEVEVTMYGQRIHVDRTYNMYFNGIKKSMPFYYPDRKSALMTITFRNSKVQIINDQYITVNFQYGSLCVQIPDVPELQGKQTLCGLGGNRDFNCKDDFIEKSGKDHPVSTCSNRYQPFTEVFGDTWITDDFLVLNPKAPICLTGQEVTNGTLAGCDVSEAKKKCLDILNAADGKGPFAACQGLGQTAIQEAYEECYFDVCQYPGLLCDQFSYFAKLCQQQIPDTPLNWRGIENCPELHCPIHASAKPCATGCPLSCHDPDYQPECSTGCMEGCECDPGYYLDESDPKNPRCVHLDECGCTDDDGNYHEAGDRWLTDDCTVLNYCQNGTYHHEKKPCSEHGHCAIDSQFAHKCVCDQGYDGDGYKCTDIDECLDLHTCNVDLLHGNCTNTPGSHYCTCHPYYDDKGNCDKWLPIRHCADLLIYHNKTADGVYDLKPAYPLNGKPAYTPATVYCDMTKLDGGWTVMGASNSNSMSNRTYTDYVLGFGNPAKQDLWLGLEFIYKMTREMNTSLRVDLHHCAGKRKPEKSTYCTYPEFKTQDSTHQYAVIIPYACDGTEITYDDGWARWDGDIGPKFTAMNIDKGDCSEYYQSTGWWYDEEHHCGVANLNGVRYQCGASAPSQGDLTHYLEWNGNPVNFAELYLRPAAFPDYEFPSTLLPPTVEPVDPTGKSKAECPCKFDISTRVKIGTTDYEFALRTDPLNNCQFYAVTPLKEFKTTIFGYKLPDFTDVLYQKDYQNTEFIATIECDVNDVTKVHLKASDTQNSVSNSYSSVGIIS